MSISSCHAFAPARARCRSCDAGLRRRCPAARAQPRLVESCSKLASSRTSPRAATNADPSLDHVRCLGQVCFAGMRQATGSSFASRSRPTSAPSRARRTRAILTHPPSGASDERTFPSSFPIGSSSLFLGERQKIPTVGSSLPPPRGVALAPASPALAAVGARPRASVVARRPVFGRALRSLVLRPPVPARGLASRVCVGRVRFRRRAVPRSPRAGPRCAVGPRPRSVARGRPRGAGASAPRSGAGGARLPPPPLLRSVGRAPLRAARPRSCARRSRAGFGARGRLPPPLGTAPSLDGGDLHLHAALHHLPCGPPSPGHAAEDGRQMTTPPHDVTRTIPHQSVSRSYSSGAWLVP